MHIISPDILLLKIKGPLTYCKSHSGQILIFEKTKIKKIK